MVRRAPQWACSYLRLLLAAVLTFLSANSVAPGQETAPALNPFAPRPAIPANARRGTVRFSNGKVLEGHIYLTPGLRWKFFDEKHKRYLQLPLRAIKRVEALVEREWMEREWRFKEAASNEKVYTGRTYPARKLKYRVTLSNGTVLVGTGSTVLYVVPESDGSPPERSGTRSKPTKIILQQRQKGKPGEKLKDLVYVKSIEFDAEGVDTGNSGGRGFPGESARSGR